MSAARKKELLGSEGESNQFIGWYEGYHRRDEEVETLRAELERERIRVRDLEWELEKFRKFAATNPVVERRILNEPKRRPKRRAALSTTRGAP